MDELLRTYWLITPEDRVEMFNMTRPEGEDMEVMIQEAAEMFPEYIYMYVDYGLLEDQEDEDIFQHPTLLEL